MTLIKIGIIFFILTAVWIIVSQVIAYIITPEPKYEEDVRNMSMSVFIAPILIMILFLGVLDLKIKTKMYDYGYTNKNPENKIDL